MYDSTEATKEHIETVSRNLGFHVSELMYRAFKHDASKLVAPEKESFDAVGPSLGALEYGSDAYNAAKASLSDGLLHHYAHNTHHPEHFCEATTLEGMAEECKTGIPLSKMTLYDLDEMYNDWKAAVARMKDGGSFPKSVDYNKTRFGMSEQIALIFLNTWDYDNGV